MSTPTSSEIDLALGREPTPRPEPRNRAEAISNDVGDLDDRVGQLVEKHRASGETHEQAHARLMSQHPDLYAGHKAAKAAILKRAGVSGAASGGGF